MIAGPIRIGDCLDRHLQLAHPADDRLDCREVPLPGSMRPDRHVPTGGSRRPRASWLLVLGAIALCAGLPAVLSISQSPSPAGGALRGDKASLPSPINQASDADAQSEMHDQQGKASTFTAANLERRKQMSEDSEKLLKLATELKAEVDKSTKDTLSLGVIRKADEIEKLAHAVKEKMKSSNAGN